MEEDRGMGVTVIAAYQDEQDANAHANQSSHYWVEQCKLHLSSINK